MVAHENCTQCLHAFHRIRGVIRLIHTFAYPAENYLSWDISHGICQNPTPGIPMVPGEPSGGITNHQRRSCSTFRIRGMRSIMRFWQPGLRLHTFRTKPCMGLHKDLRTGSGRSFLYSLFPDFLYFFNKFWNSFVEIFLYEVVRILDYLCIRIIVYCNNGPARLHSHNVLGFS